MPATLSPTIAETDQSDAIDYLGDPFIDRIWRDLSGQVTYELIRRVVAEEAAKFQNARITTFVPIFIRRNTREKLLTQGDRIKIGSELPCGYSPMTESRQSNTGG